MLPQKLAFVDVETTGMRSASDRIIEIGIVRVEDNHVVRKFQTLLNPQTYINPIIETLTGIQPSMLENAPLFTDIKEELLDILDDCIFVAHNVRFDYSFLKNEFRHAGASFSPKQFCTVKLSKALFPRETHHNLDKIIERFNIACPNRHRAFDDAFVLWEFYQKIQQSFPLGHIEKAVSTIMKKPSLPIKLPANTLSLLPSSPGVYIFYGENGTPLYIGKSVNIKDRVLSHFSQDHASSTEMKISQQIESIETIPTTGELGALFKEAALIKKMQPLYNRKLRNCSKLLVLRNKITPDGYNSVYFEHLTSPNVPDTDNILGIFKSKKQLKNFLIDMTEKYNLCEKILGLEATKSACFGYRLGRCKGACINKESPTLYNLRFILAFSQNKIKPWPFTGPIYITEGDKNNTEVFIVDKWCFLGSFKDSNDIRTFSVDDYQFDLDNYKILESFLRKEKNLKLITTSLKQHLSPIEQLPEEAASLFLNQ